MFYKVSFHEWCISGSTPTYCFFFYERWILGFTILFELHKIIVAVILQLPLSNFLLDLFGGTRDVYIVFERGDRPSKPLSEILLRWSWIDIIISILFINSELYNIWRKIPVVYFIVAYKHFKIPIWSILCIRIYYALHQNHPWIIVHCSRMEHRRSNRQNE